MKVKSDTSIRQQVTTYRQWYIPAWFNFYFIFILFYKELHVLDVLGHRVISDSGFQKTCGKRFFHISSRPDLWPTCAGRARRITSSYIGAPTCWKTRRASVGGNRGWHKLCASGGLAGPPWPLLQDICENQGLPTLLIQSCTPWKSFCENMCGLASDNLQLDGGGRLWTAEKCPCCCDSTWHDCTVPVVPARQHPGICAGGPEGHSMSPPKCPQASCLCHQSWKENLV